MTIADIAAGHTAIAEWLELLSAILFVLGGMVTTTERPDPSKGALIPAGLALLAIAFIFL